MDWSFATPRFGRPRWMGHMLSMIIKRVLLKYKVSQHGFGTNLKRYTLIFCSQNSFFHFYTGKMLGKNAWWILKYKKICLQKWPQSILNTLYIKREIERKTGWGRQFWLILINLSGGFELSMSCMITKFNLELFPNIIYVTIV